MNVLFICNQNKHRSKTAEELFRNKWNTKSAGLYGGNIISEKILSWADMVAVMEEEQRHELSKRFPELYLQKKIISLNIPDMYSYGQLELKELLKMKIVDLL